MSEILVSRLKKSVGERVIIYTNNGFRFEGKIIGCDDNHVEILETRGIKIISIKEISDLDLSYKGEKHEN